MAAALDLGNVRVHPVRAEEAGRGGLRDSSGLVTARAVAELRELLEYTAPLAATGGKTFKLSQHKNLLVLYFYPKDNTPGCTTEAKNFSRDYDKFKALNAEIVGVSLDDVESHQDFAKTIGIPFPLLADTEEKAAKAYDVLGGMGPIKYTKRQTFVINPEGFVVKHYESVNADEHSAQVLTDLQAM